MQHPEPQLSTTEQPAAYVEDAALRAAYDLAHSAAPERFDHEDPSQTL